MAEYTTRRCGCGRDLPDDSWEEEERDDEIVVSYQTTTCRECAKRGLVTAIVRNMLHG